MRGLAELPLLLQLRSPYSVSKAITLRQQQPLQPQSSSTRY